jgi:hypothetical protein
MLNSKVSKIGFLNKRNPARRDAVAGFHDFKIGGAT